MSETENAFLKSEIVRLNKTIEALLSYSEVLRQQIDIHEKGNGTLNLGSAGHEKGNETPNIGSAIHEKGNGTPNLGSPIHEKGNGTLNLGSHVHEKVEITTATVSTLHLKLRSKITGKVKRSATQSSAKLLIHIYNGGKGGYTELSRLTGLSRGGVGKRIMAMKKQGLIISDGHLNYNLTTKGMELVKGLMG